MCFKNCIVIILPFNNFWLMITSANNYYYNLEDWQLPHEYFPFIYILLTTSKPLILFCQNSLPITLLAKEDFFSVASPRSPIFTNPVVPLMKILSHFKSLWIIGGVRVCRNCNPFKICLHQLFRIFSLTPLNLFKYL